MEKQQIGELSTRRKIRLSKLSEFQVDNLLSPNLSASDLIPERKEVTPEDSLSDESVSSFDEIPILPTVGGPHRLKTLLEEYIKITSKTPIEKFEVDLYNTVDKCYETIHGSLKLKDLLLSYPLFNSCAIEENSNLKSLGKSELVQYILQRDPMLSVRHRITHEFCELISSLLIKWDIFNFNKYEFRYNVRMHLIKILDISKLNSRCFNLETLWFCVGINEKLFPEIMTKELKQYSQLLENQMNSVFKLLLKERYNCIPSIEDAVGMKSKVYRKKYLKRDPIPYIGINNYFTLSKPTMCNKKKLRDTIELIEAVKELEYIYRLFERELFGRFLLVF